MSFEGYELVICKNGHVTYAGSVFCSECGEAWVDSALVDETNGLPYTLEFRLVELTPAVNETCHCCGFTTNRAPATYRMEHCEPYQSEDGNYVVSESK